MSHKQGEEILNLITKGLLNEGLALKKEVEEISKQKHKGQEIDVTNFSQTALKMYSMLITEHGYSTTEELENLH